MVDYSHTDETLHCRRQFNDNKNKGILKKQTDQKSRSQTDECQKSSFESWVKVILRSPLVSFFGSKTKQGLVKIGVVCVYICGRGEVGASWLGGWVISRRFLWWHIICFESV